MRWAWGAVVVVLAGPPLAAAERLVEVAPGSVVRWSKAGTTACVLESRRFEPIGETCYFPIDLRRTGDLQGSRTVAGAEERVRFRIGDYPYDVQRLEIEDESRVNLSPQDLARVNRENQRIGALWSRAGSRHFELPLAPPLDPLPEGGRFGAKRIINGEPRSPHTGSDFGAARGTPVKATAAGEVVLAEEHFFAGNSVFLDHGDGLISMYFHLDSIAVKAGQAVEQGEVIGMVGSTGRATGPHLHFGLRWHGARIDPEQLLEPASKLREID